MTKRPLENERVNHNRLISLKTYLNPKRAVAGISVGHFRRRYVSRRGRVLSQVPDANLAAELAAKDNIRVLGVVLHT